MGNKPPSRVQGELSRVAESTTAAIGSGTGDTRDEARAASIGTKQAPLDGLDRLEYTILTAIAAGDGIPEIAASLGLSEELVGANVTSVLAKLHRRHAAPFVEDHAEVQAEGGARTDRPTG